MAEHEYLVWSRLRSRLMDLLPTCGDYERRSATAEYITRELMAAPELVISAGEWPAPQPPEGDDG